jgi:hypothetical protein
MSRLGVISLDSCVSEAEVDCEEREEQSVVRFRSELHVQNPFNDGFLVLSFPLGRTSGIFSES